MGLPNGLMFIDGLHAFLTPVCGDKLVALEMGKVPSLISFFLLENFRKISTILGPGVVQNDQMSWKASPVKESGQQLLPGPRQGKKRRQNWPFLTSGTVWTPFRVVSPQVPVRISLNW